MTTKTKAADLISRFLESDKMVFNIEGAKECALIAVDEVLYCLNMNHDNVYFWNPEYEYYKEVKQEIKNL